MAWHTESTLVLDRSATCARHCHQSKEKLIKPNQLTLPWHLWHSCSQVPGSGRFGPGMEADRSYSPVPPFAAWQSPTELWGKWELSQGHFPVWCQNSRNAPTRGHNGQSPTGITPQLWVQGQAPLGPTEQQKLLSWAGPGNQLRLQPGQRIEQLGLSPTHTVHAPASGLQGSLSLWRRTQDRTPWGSAICSCLPPVPARPHGSLVVERGDKHLSQSWLPPPVQWPAQDQPWP